MLYILVIISRFIKLININILLSIYKYYLLLLNHISYILDVIIQIC